MIVYALVSVGKNVLAEYTATFGKLNDLLSQFLFITTIKRDGNVMSRTTTWFVAA